MQFFFLSLVTLFATVNAFRATFPPAYRLKSLSSTQFIEPDTVKIEHTTSPPPINTQSFRVMAPSDSSPETKENLALFVVDLSGPGCKKRLEYQFNPLHYDASDVF